MDLEKRATSRWPHGDEIEIHYSNMYFELADDRSGDNSVERPMIVGGFDVAHSE